MSTPRATRSRLSALVARLVKFHGRVAEPLPRDPYLFLLYEHVAYLADDATRLAAYRLLEKLVGTAPDAILSAPIAVLRKVTRAGGPIAFELRATRLQQVAQRVAGEWDGNLRAVLKHPYEDARRELMKYPSIGKPGAERILLVCGASTTLGLETNSMRVLARLGYGSETKDFARTYVSIQAAAARELPATVRARRTAYLVLRAHGQTVCRRSKPECGRCPLVRDCPTGRLNMMSHPSRRSS